MAYTVSIETLDDLSNLYTKDLEISQSIATTILKNLNTTKRWVPALEIYIEKSDKTINYTIDKESFIPVLDSKILCRVTSMEKLVLEKCLKLHEVFEEYEFCSTINNAINKLKNKENGKIKN